MMMAIRVIALSLIVLAAIFLATPIVWLKVVGGDFSAPDIYIHGAYITGKDLRFWGINFAYKFQLSVVLFFIFTNVLTGLKKVGKAKMIILSCLNLLLLLLFPYWLKQYIYGVECNSDSVKLLVNYQVGYAMFWVILSLNILLVIILSMKKGKKEQSDSKSGSENILDAQL